MFAASLWTIVLIIINGACGLDPPSVTQPSDTGDPLLSVHRLFSIQQTLTEEYFSSYYTQNPVQSEYDYVIIGAGPAGCVLANRLSENERNSVLLLEAGSAESPLVTNAPMAAANLQSTSYNWNYATEPQKDACLCTCMQTCD